MLLVCLSLCVYCVHDSSRRFFYIIKLDNHDNRHRTPKIFIQLLIQFNLFSRLTIVGRQIEPKKKLYEVSAPVTNERIIIFPSTFAVCVIENIKTKTGVQ